MGQDDEQHAQLTIGSDAPGSGQGGLGGAGGEAGEKGHLNAIGLNGGPRGGLSRGQERQCKSGTQFQVSGLSCREPGSGV